MTRARRWAAVLIASVLWAVLNRAAALFEISPGLSFFFPAAAVTVAAGVVLGWWGAAAVLVAPFIAPWGASVGLLRTFLFALPGALWAALLVLLPRHPGSSWERTWRLTLFGLVGGGVASAALGAMLLTLLVGPPGWLAAARAAVGWLVPDVMAALVFGLPLLVLAAPNAILDGEDESTWRAWVRSRAALSAAAALAAACVGVVVLAALAGGNPHWFVALLMLPVALAALRGGLGAGLIMNGTASAAYLALVLLGNGAAQSLPLRLAPVYANLFVLFAFAVMTGILAGRERHLAAEVRRQGRDIARGLESTVRALAAAMEAKDRLADHHVQRVVRLAVLVGQDLGLDDERLAAVRRAAILHDVGKIGVPEDILNKPGPLTPTERRAVQRHVDLGLAILEPVEFLRPVLELVRYHQERWDGDTGARFPAYQGLRGTEIPLGARIIAAVNAFDAMTHDRPYRAAMSREAALAELWRCSGTQFDAEVVRVLTRVLREEWARAEDQREISGEVLV